MDLEENIWGVLSSRVQEKESGIYLVKWVGYRPDENTWEPYENLTDGAEDAKQNGYINQAIEQLTSVMENKMTGKN